MPLKLDILKPTREKNKDINVIYNDLNLKMDVGVVKGDEIEKPDNLKDLKTATNFEAIKNSLINLITTFPGQKILNPEFGINFGDLLFLPVSKARAITIGEAINNNVVGFEPRVKFNVIEVIADITNQEYELNIEISIPEFDNNPLNLKGKLNRSGFYSY